MHKILLVEDDEILGDSLKESLEDEGFLVVWSRDGKEALDATYDSEFDIYIIDVNIPFLSGFELLSELRESGDKTPAIFLTALNDSSSVKKGFESGCDDYVKKPFDFDELLVRIEAKIKSSYKSYSSVLEYGELKFNIENRTLIKDNKVIHLTPTEQKLVEKFFKNIDKIVPTFELLELAGENSTPSSLRVHITNLKKMGLKLKNVRAEGYICEKT